MDFNDFWLRHLLGNCLNMNAIGLHWWSANIGSGNGLVPSGNKPLPEPMLTKIPVAHMASLGHNELTHFAGNSPSEIRLWFQCENFKQIVMTDILTISYRDLSQMNVKELIDGKSTLNLVMFWCSLILVCGLPLEWKFTACQLIQEKNSGISAHYLNGPGKKS